MKILRSYKLASKKLLAFMMDFAVFHATNCYISWGSVLSKLGTT